MRQFLKYEFKNNWKAFTFSYALIIASFIMLSIFILIVQSMNNVEENALIYILYSNIILLIFGALCFSACLFIINLVKSFYKSIFSDEGYLTLSFPKTTNNLLLSKIFVNFIWVIIFYISIAIGFLFIAITISSDSVIWIFEEILKLISQIDNSLLVIPFYVLMSIVKIILTFVMLLFSFAIINTGFIRKAKVFMGILVFMLLNYGLSIIEMFTSYISFGVASSSGNELIFAFGSVWSETFLNSGAVTYVFNITDFIIYVGLIIGLYIFTKHIIENYLEME